MTIEHIDPKAIQQSKGTKFKAMGGTDFNAILDTINAGVMGPAGVAVQQHGSPNSQAVLAAAFSGINEVGAATGGMSAMSGMGGGAYGTSYGATPSFAAGYSGGTNYKASSLGSLDPNASMMGVDGVSQMDMINTMNSNNLELLELQAVMQSNMQSWNTKSNILSADHRARMAMIEKFTVR